MPAWDGTLPRIVFAIACIAFCKTISEEDNVGSGGRCAAIGGRTKKYAGDGMRDTWRLTHDADNGAGVGQNAKFRSAFI